MKLSKIINVVMVGLSLPTVLAQNVTNPIQHFASANGLTSSDLIQKIEVDLNGDAVNDMLLAYEDPNPDIIERQARRKDGGWVRWDAYVKSVDGTYMVSKGIIKGEGLSVVAGLPLRLDHVHAGQVSEISKYALVAFDLSKIKGQAPTISIFAYTWEGDHFKEHPLASYLEEEQNTLFDKYLAEGKRTVFQVQRVNP